MFYVRPEKPALGPIGYFHIAKISVSFSKAATKNNYLNIILFGNEIKKIQKLAHCAI